MEVFGQGCGGCLTAVTSKDVTMVHQSRKYRGIDCLCVIDRREMMQRMVLEPGSTGSDRERERERERERGRART